MGGALDKLTARERRLFGITVSVVLFAVAAWGVRAALANLRELDERIAGLEFELDTLQQQFVQRGAVDAAYNAVVSEHSSNLTTSEIHDHLRRAIYALSQVTFPPRDGKPARTVQLVQIPTIDKGELKQDEGHREYRIRIDIPSASLNLLLTFIGRIETSDQLLRIDRLDIGRIPGTQTVHASMDITRTVLDDPSASSGPAGGNSSE